MKSKIVIFKFLAAIIAVGGAFASVSANSALALTSAYVHYTTNNVPNRNLSYCTRVGDICETTGLQTCVVTVTWTAAPAPGSFSYSTKENQCSIVLPHTTNSSILTKTIAKTNVTLLP